MASVDMTVLAEEISTCLATDDQSTLRLLTEGYHPADLAEAMRLLDKKERTSFFEFLGEEKAGDVLSNLPEQIEEQITDHVSDERLSDIIEEMEPDDAADVIDRMEPDQADRVLALMEDEDSREVIELLRYDEDTAGGIMTTELCAVPFSYTVDETINFIRGQEEDEDLHIHYVYAVDDDFRLKGVLPIRRLLMKKGSVRLSDIMVSNVISVPHELDQEEVAHLFEKYDLVSIPVVDRTNKLLGRITVDDIIDVIHDEAEEDLALMAGTDEYDFENMTAFASAKVRIPWLATCLLGSLLAGVVMRFFEATLKEVVTLMIFVPAIMAMGGNSGLQSATIVVRGLGKGNILISELPRILLKEFRSALMIGLIMGSAMALVARAWLGDWHVAIGVGSSLTLAITLAGTNGVIIPMLFKKIGVDPAIASGPLITTMNDVIGLTVYLTIASLFI